MQSGEVQNGLVKEANYVSIHEMKVIKSATSQVSERIMGWIKVKQELLTPSAEAVRSGGKIISYLAIIIIGGLVATISFS